MDARDDDGGGAPGAELLTARLRLAATLTRHAFAAIIIDRGAQMRGWAWVLLAACSGDPKDPPIDTVDPDTVAPDTVDTVPPDTIDTIDTVDTPPPDDTVEPVDTDAAHTDPPVDTPAPEPIPDLGRGFVDLTPALLASFPRDVADRTDPNGDEPDQTHGLFVDLDRDGATEVVLLGTAPAPNVPRAAWVLRFDPATESLVPDTTLTSRLATQDPLILGILDLDGDGMVDVLPGHTESPPRRGSANGSFEPARQALPYVPGLMGGNATDIDHDGWADLLRVGGGCRTGDAWSATVRTGLTTWTDMPELLGPENPSSPYTTALVALAGQDVVLGLGLGCNQAAWSPAFFVPTSTAASGYPLFTGTDLTPPDSAYKLQPYVAGGPLTRRNPMGAAVADLDGDSDLDLAVASVDERVMIFEDQGGALLADATSARDAWLPERGDDGSGGPYDRVKPWGIAALDLDRDGALDLVTQTGFDYSDWHNGVGGFNAAVGLIQRGGVFVDASLALSLPSDSNGRSLTVGDLDLDGRPDLILGAMGAPPRVMLNRIDGVRPPIGLRLVGASGWPAGAVVEIIDDGVTSPLQVVGGSISPGPVSEPIVFGTTGADGIVDLVRVTWASGFVQEFPSLTANTTHTLREPVLLTASPSDRHAPRSGTATLHLFPRAADGSLRAAPVVVTLAAGSGTPAAPVATPEGWDVVITGPGTAGSSVFEVWIDGEALAIRPRIWWD